MQGTFMCLFTKGIQESWTRKHWTNDFLVHGPFLSSKWCNIFESALLDDESRRVHDSSGQLLFQFSKFISDTTTFPLGRGREDRV